MDNNHDDNGQTPAGMSRAEYRRQLIHHDDQQSAHQADHDQVATDRQSTTGSREDTAQERKMAVSNERMMRLKRRLNIAIAALVVATVIVYLILFLVK